MNEKNGYKHLEKRPGANYEQLYVKGRKIRAQVLYSETIGEDARTPEEVACDYHLPLEVILEAIDYCVHNPLVLERDLERDLASERERPSIMPKDVVSKT